MCFIRVKYIIVLRKDQLDKLLFDMRRYAYYRRTKNMIF